MRRFGQLIQIKPESIEEAANGSMSGPPAPPRDQLAQLSDFYEAFDFSQNPNSYPNLPAVSDWRLW